MPTDRLCAASLGAGLAIEPSELVALARGVFEASGPLVGERDAEVETGTVGRHLQARLQLANRAVDIAAVEQRLAERLPRGEGVRRGSHRLSGDRQRGGGVALLQVLERHLHQRPGMPRLDVELALELLDRLLTLLLEQEHAEGIVDV